MNDWWRTLIVSAVVGVLELLLVYFIASHFVRKSVLKKQANQEHEQSNLVDHAERELRLVGEDPETIDWYKDVIRAFNKLGHSGGSAMVTIPVLNDLLQFKNLMPLTDDPDEWQHHNEDVWGEAGGIWQNRRNSQAFSHDGGKTYYLLSEGANDDRRYPLHLAASSEDPRALVACPTAGCPGDAKYSAPGDGHLEKCNYPYRNE